MSIQPCIFNILSHNKNFPNLKLQHQPAFMVLHFGNSLTIWCHGRNSTFPCHQNGIWLGFCDEGRCRPHIQCRAACSLLWLRQGQPSSLRGNWYVDKDEKSAIWTNSRVHCDLLFFSLFLNWIGISLKTNCMVDTRFVLNHQGTPWEMLYRWKISSVESLFYPVDNKLCEENSIKTVELINIIVNKPV